MPKLEGQDLRNPILDCIKRFNFPRAFRLIKHYHEHLIKYSRFQQFIKSEMPVSAKSYTQKSLAAEHLDYDALVVESDEDNAADDIGVVVPENFCVFRIMMVA